MDNLKAIVIDDEPLARELIINYLKNQDRIEVIAEAENGFEALKLIHDLNPDLIFLDIQMPKINGFELLEVIDQKPAVIFTTAFDQYAIRAFEMNAIDYLLKPFSKDRLFQAIDKVIKLTPADNRKNLQKVEEYLNTVNKKLERIVVRQGSKIHVIALEKIWFIEAEDDYVLIHTESGKFLKDKTMKYFEEHLPDEFIRIHRSYIVNIAQISGIEHYIKNTHLVKLKCGASLRASQEGYKRLKEIL